MPRLGTVMYKQALTSTSLLLLSAITIPWSALAMDIGNAPASAELAFRVIIPPVLRFTLGEHRPSDAHATTTPPRPSIEVVSHARFLSVTMSPVKAPPAASFKEGAETAMSVNTQSIEEASADAGRPVKALTLLAPKKAASDYAMLRFHQYVPLGSGQSMKSRRVIYTVSAP